MSELSPSNQFVLKEYDSAITLTYHIDELRSKLTSFYVTFSGIAGAGLIMLMKGEAKASSGLKAYEVVSLLMAMVALVGIVIVGIVARLRRAQLEHFRIINNVRSHFLGSDIDLWNVVELSASTLPSPNRKSGSYMWVFLIILISAFFLAFGVNLYLFGSLGASAGATKLASVAVFLIGILGLDCVYLRLARPVPPRNYSERGAAITAPGEQGGAGQPATRSESE